MEWFLENECREGMILSRSGIVVVMILTERDFEYILVDDISCRPLFGKIKFYF